MRITELKVYIKYLSRYKLYTVATITGFSVAMMFVILLGVYVRQEFSADNFHEKGDRIYLLTHDKYGNNANAVGDYVKERCPEVEAYCRICKENRILKMPEGDQFAVNILFADSTFFTMFSFPLSEGMPSEVLKSEQSVVLTRSLLRKMSWKNSPVGRSINIGGKEYLITGVAEDIPTNTQIPECDLIMNYSGIKESCGQDILTNWGNCSFVIYFLEKEGADLSAKTSMLLSSFKEDYWLYKGGFAKDLYFMPMQDVYLGGLNGYFMIRGNSRMLVYVYAGIAVLILVVSILNYINLTVAQSAVRGKELAMKRMLGCSRNRLMLQNFEESLLILFLSFVLGILLSFLAEPLFNDLLGTRLELWKHISFTEALYTISLLILLSLISGLTPSLLISGFRPVDVLKGTFVRKTKTGYLRIFSIFQYIVSITLLICGFFALRQTSYLFNYDLGFGHNVIMKMPNLLSLDQESGMRNRLLSIAGVEAVSFSSGSPLNGGNNMSFNYQGTPLSFQEFRVDSFFFDVFDIRVVESTGVPFSGKSFYVNRLGFNALHPDTISFSFKDPIGTCQIAGIVEDFHFRPLHQPIGLVRIGLRDEFSDAMFGVWDIYVKLNPKADLHKTAEAVLSAYMEYNGGRWVSYSFSDEITQRQYEKERRLSSLIGIFTGLTLLIMLMGVLAMSLYQVQSKEKEIAVRRVNGSTEQEILVLLNRSSLYSLLISFLISVPISYYIMTRWLETFAYRISLSWWIFIVSGLIVLILSSLFITLQSWKTVRRNPTELLRNE